MIEIVDIHVANCTSPTLPWELKYNRLFWSSDIHRLMYATNTGCYIEILPKRFRVIGEWSRPASRTVRGRLFNDKVRRNSNKYENSSCAPYLVHST